MTTYLLAQSNIFNGGPSLVISLSFLLLYIFIFVLIISVLVRLSRYLGSAKKEQQLMRMEITKIAGEMELLRKKLVDEFPQQNSSQ